MPGLTLPLVIALPLAFAGQDATSYTYDALGRLTKVTTTGGSCGAPESFYTLDPAGNRSNVTVSGVASCSRKVIVVPSAGYAVIPID